MNNSNFVTTDEFTKVSNLVDVLYKRCRGFIKKEVLISVVNRLDLTKQMLIEIVNENEFKSKVKEMAVIHFNNNDVHQVDVQWVRVLMGSVDIGREVIHSSKEELVSVINEPTSIITYPAIAIIENQTLGSADTINKRLIIYI